MDWKSHRVEALLEQALLEDKAVSDATTNVTIDANLRASASIIARQEMVVAGLGAVPRQGRRTSVSNTSAIRVFPLRLAALTRAMYEKQSNCATAWVASAHRAIGR